MPLLRPPIPRLPIRHVYRAFRELDPYSDKQCSRFVAAARGSFHRSLFTAALIGLIALLGTAAGIAAFWFVQSSYLAQHRTLNIGHSLITWYGWLLNIALGIIGFAVGPILGYLARDFLLIRRIRYILRTRGVCFSCRYTLVGLFVGDDLNVTCPECGTTTTVDPALGELVTDETGRPRFRPDETRHKARKFWTQRRLRGLMRTVITLFLLIILLAGVYEGFLRWQASAARKDRGLARLNETMIALATRNARLSDSNAWDAFDRAAMRRTEVDQDAWLSSNGSIRPSFDLIFNPSARRRGSLPEENEPERRSRELALQLIERYREAGVYESLEDLAVSPLALRLIDLPDSAPIIEVLLPYLGDARILATICAARLHLAARAGQRKEFESALDSGLAIVRLLDNRATLADRLTASALEILLLDRVADTLTRPVPDDWVELAHAILDRQLPGEPDLGWVEHERTMVLDAIAWIFSDPAQVRFGRWSPFLRQFYPNQWTKWHQLKPLGTYDQNHRTVNAIFDELAILVKKPIPALYPGHDLHAAGEDLLLVDAFVSGHDRSLNAHHKRLVYRRAARTMLAIERYRIARGSYPNELADLIPDFLNVLPVDPWSGEPLGYRRTEPSTDLHRRSYLLYSVGADLVDNGGTSPESRYRGQVLSLTPTRHTTETDYIFNEPKSLE